MSFHDEAVAGKRFAEAYHVLWWIDYDGRSWRVTIGEPDERGAGVFEITWMEDTLNEALATAARQHDLRFCPEPIRHIFQVPQPAMKFHYTEAALAAARA